MRRTTCPDNTGQAVRIGRTDNNPPLGVVVRPLSGPSEEHWTLVAERDDLPERRHLDYAPVAATNQRPTRLEIAAALEAVASLFGQQPPKRGGH